MPPVALARARAARLYAGLDESRRRLADRSRNRGFLGLLESADESLVMWWNAYVISACILDVRIVPDDHPHGCSLTIDGGAMEMGRVRLSPFGIGRLTDELARLMAEDGQPARAAVDRYTLVCRDNESGTVSARVALRNPGLACRGAARIVHLVNRHLHRSGTAD
jgi:hypothetical protein